MAFKIPFTNIELGRARAEAPSPDERTRNAKRASKAIWRTQLYRSRQRISEWKAAVSEAESETHPDRTELTKLYNELVNDLHLWSVMQTITLRLQSTGYVSESSPGVVNEEVTKQLRSRWFRDIIKYYVESKFHGFSLIQIGGVQGGKLINNELIPRQYVVPEARAIKLTSSSRVPKRGDFSRKTAISFDDAPYDRWLIPIGEPDSLGLLQKCAPAVILKKEAVAAWGEFGEVFGMPFRAMFTDIDDPAIRADSEAMLSGMGRAGWGIFNTQDKLEFITAQNSDAYNVYFEFINTQNAEISKGILGQTMTTEDGSSRSQAEVHDSALDHIISAYLRDCADLINDVVFPKLKALGVIPVGETFAWDLEQELSPAELLAIVKELLAHYKVPPDWILEKFGVPVEDEPEPMLPDPFAPVPGEDPVLGKIKSFYAKAEANKCNH